MPHVQFVNGRVGTTGVHLVVHKTFTTHPNLLETKRV